METKAAAAPPARANSLQKMLELEKQFMYQRMQSKGAPGAPPQIHDKPAPARPTIHARRTEPVSVSPNEPRSAFRSPRRRSAAMQPPPLVINPSPPKLTAAQLEDIAAVVGQLDSPSFSIPKLDSPSSSIAADKPSPKVVAFQFPPEFEDRKSLCQSPTWEAYDKRKKEKKDERKEEKRRELQKKEQEKKKEEERKREEKKRMDEKKEREDAAKKQAAAIPKPRRLSKPPPAHALRHAPTAPVNAPPMPRPAPRTTKPRPNSALGLVFPSSEPAEGSGRKRSGSFTSLIKSFEVRRSSIDQTRDGGFIGGIKLEQRRYEAEQKALDAQLKADEANIHPALRTNRADSGSSSPIRSPNPEGEKRRAYPPIAILTSSKMERLRARVGFKTKNDSAKGPDSAMSSNVSLPQIDVNAVRTSLDHSWKYNPSSSGLAAEPIKKSLEKSEKHDLALTIKVPSREEQLPPYEATPSTAGRPSVDIEPTLADLIAQDKAHGSDTELLPPRIRPPRKSSKRSLTTNGSDASPVRTTPRLHSATNSISADSPQDYLGLFNGPYTPLSMEFPDASDEAPPTVTPKPHMRKESTASDFQTDYLSVSRQGNLTPKSPAASSFKSQSSNQKLKEAAKDGPAGSNSSIASRPKSSSNLPAKAATRALGETNNKSLGNLIMAARRQSSSSDDSFYDEFNFHSPTSTPNTSRPQSEKEVTPVPTDTENGPTLRERRSKSSKLKQNTTQEQLVPPPPPQTPGRDRRRHNSQTSVDDDIEFDRIQAAARKVMAAFPDASSPRPSVDRRTQSESNVAPRPKPQTLRKDKSSGRLNHVISLPYSETSPATKSPKFQEPKQKTGSAVNLAQTLKPPQGAMSPALSPKSLTATMASQSSSTDISSKTMLRKQNVPPSPNAPVAKMFVECCSCRYYHDMPSRLYEAMVNPEAALSPGDTQAFAGSASMTVRCPWCAHDMSSKCCAGIAAMVFVKERLH